MHEVSERKVTLTYTFSGGLILISQYFSLCGKKKRGKGLNLEELYGMRTPVKRSSELSFLFLNRTFVYETILSTG